jgi:hypothetical protein
MSNILGHPLPNEARMMLNKGAMNDTFHAKSSHAIEELPSKVLTRG